MAPPIAPTMLTKTSFSTAPATVLQQDSYQAQWSQWLEVAFGGAATVVSMYLCVVKVLDRRRKKKDTGVGTNPRPDHNFPPVQHDEADPSITMTDRDVVQDIDGTHEAQGQNDEVADRCGPVEIREESA